MLEKYPEFQAYIDYKVEREYKLREAQSCYNLIGNHFHWKIDAVYEDAIIDIIGQHGFSLIREFHLMEPCGSIDGRKLYAL